MFFRATMPCVRTVGCGSAFGVRAFTTFGACPRVMLHQRSSLARRPAFVYAAFANDTKTAMRTFATVPGGGGGGGAPGDNNNDNKAKKKKPKFADLFRDHGPVFAVYYLSLWSMTGGLFYGALQSGALGPTVALDLVRTLSLDSYINLDNISPATGNLALALLLNEAAEVVRLPFIVVTTPIVSRAWRRFRGERPPGGIAARVSSAFDKYGKFAFWYWVSLYSLCGAGWYAGLEFLGKEAAFDLIQQVANSTNLGSVVKLEISQLDSVAGKLSAVLVLNEMLEVVRVPVVLTTTPMLYRLFNKDKAA